MDKNKEFLIFEDYTQSVCRKIMSVKKKNEICEELYSHLFEEYDKNIALGMDEETAQIKAVEKMGNKEKIADEFGEIYSISPARYIRSSLNLLITGIIFTVFELNFLSEGMPELLKFLGTALMVYSLAKLRKSERNLNKAMWLVVITYVANTTSNLIAMYVPKYNPITIWSIIISLFLLDLLYWWIFSGLQNLYNKHKTEFDNKSSGMFLAFCMWILFSIVAFIGIIYEAPELAYIGIVPIIIMLCQLGRVKKLLSDSENEFNLEHPLVEWEKIVCLIMIFIMAVSPIFTMIGIGNIDPESEVYSIVDTEISKEEIIKVRLHLSDLGLPQKHIDDLPDSEVLKYTYATYMQNEYKHHKLLNDCDEYTAIYYFYFPDGVVRTLMYVEISNELNTNHRNGLYMMFDTGFVPINNDATENYTDNYGKFFLALSEKDEKTYSSKVFTEYERANTLHRISGNEFSFPDNSTNRRAYLAYSAVISYPTIVQRIFVSGVYYYQRIPVRANWSSFNSIAETDLVDGTVSYAYKTPVYSRYLGYSFEYNPEYCNETK